jgi:hypothetical protein
MQSVSDLLDAQDAESGIRPSLQAKRSGESVAPKAVPPASEMPRQQQQASNVVSSGLAFFVSTEGHLVTNAHVVARCTSGCGLHRSAISSMFVAMFSTTVPSNGLSYSGAGKRG